MQKSKFVRQANLPDGAYREDALYSYAKQWHIKNCKKCKPLEECEELENLRLFLENL